MSNAKIISHMQCTQRLFAGELWGALGPIMSYLCGEGGENKETYLESLRRVLGTGSRERSPGPHS